MKSDMNDEVEELSAKLQDIYQTKGCFKEAAKYVLANFKYRRYGMWIYDHINDLGAKCDSILTGLDSIQHPKTRRAMLWHLDMVIRHRVAEIERRLNDETY